MKFLKYLVLLFIANTFFSCSENKKSNPTKIDEIQNRVLLEKKQSKVIIIGTSDDDPEALNYVNIMNHSYFFGRHHIDSHLSIVNDTLKLVLDSITAPQAMPFLTTSMDTLYRAQIFITPGDTILFEIKNRKVIFYGKKAVYNNFYTSLYESTPFYYSNSYKGDIYAYKQSLKLIYNKKLNFLKEYIDKHEIISNNFITSVEKDLKQEYLLELISPRNIKAKDINLYYNDLNGFNSIINFEYSTKETPFYYSNYFNEISVEDFKQPELISNPFFKQNLNIYIRDLFISSEHVDYSKEKLIAEKEFIEQNLDGDLKLFAIARMIRDYHIKGFGNSINNIDFMKSLINEYEGKFTKPSYLEYMTEVKQDLATYNFKLSDAALNTKLINHLGDTLTLNDIFARSKKRIKVVDFWASWCPPCITQITSEKPFKDRLLVENNVEWIYLSIDEDHEEWLKKSEKLEEFLNFNNSYYILKGKNSLLGKYLKVSWIPRYVILNKENKIVLNNAPTPSENIVFEKIIDDIFNE